MNKKEAIEIIQSLQQVFRDDESIEEALDFAVKELSKSNRDNLKTFQENLKSFAIDTIIQAVRDDIEKPSFAGTCTKCGDKSAKPEYTLCSEHYDLWMQSKETRLDYKHLVNIDSPKEVREYYNIGDIYENKGKCPKCGDIIESLNHYDYAKCSCGHSFIDGGSDYSRRNADLINLSVGFNHK